MERRGEWGGERREERRRDERRMQGEWESGKWEKKDKPY
jgi:hypothetical protein